jgi:hypothetical protein
MGEDTIITLKLQLYIISVSPRRSDRPSTKLYIRMTSDMIPIVLGEQVLSLLLHYYT